ncbi:hypothetical protein [Paenibacillus cymbidii]|uniref:hypothetical protein n=1 Tax=Paenibacillus cymbidii TaxID=1639034 RepID=UPI0010821963|nr:hypothetical protein [Paenibacillus cymbidii]
MAKKIAIGAILVIILSTIYFLLIYDKRKDDKRMIAHALEAFSSQYCHKEITVKKVVIRQRSLLLDNTIIWYAQISPSIYKFEGMYVEVLNEYHFYGESSCSEVKSFTLDRSKEEFTPNLKPKGFK